ncbi:hypothetical protein DITRI_Ditri04bG0044500 [Diplodiscus trichospermus]
MGVLAKLVIGVMDVLHIEDVLQGKALEFARDIGFYSIELEGDSATVIAKLSVVAHDLSDVGVIIEKAKCLSRCFSSCKFKHTRRDGNQVAHKLAQFSINQSDVTIWVEGHLVFVDKELAVDASFVN